MNTPLYSIRMHAERDCHHLSGAERLVAGAELEVAAAELLGRGMAAGPGSLRLSIDALDPDQIVYGGIPDIRLMPNEGCEQGRRRAVQLLTAAGVSEQSADLALAAIAAGPSSAGHAMRGAMLVDAETGERLEADRDRGVRATRMDLTGAVSGSLTALLMANGLQHSRTREALVLAAKVLACPGIIAELCWSDAPDYTAGYVASPGHGYCRFSELKPAGDRRGGRAFFVRPGFDLSAIICFLQDTPFLADRHGTIMHARDLA